MRSRYDPRIRAPRFAFLLTLALFACAQADADPAGDTSGVEFPVTHRPDVRGVHGAVSSAHPLATGAGYAILPIEGNAVHGVVAIAVFFACSMPPFDGGVG